MLTRLHITSPNRTLQIGQQILVATRSQVRAQVEYRGTSRAWKRLWTPVLDQVWNQAWLQVLRRLREEPV